MVSQKRADRLSRRASGEGWAAERAVRALVNAGDRGDQRAINTMWTLWLANPRDEFWEPLSRWRRVSTGSNADMSRIALGDGNLAVRDLRELVVRIAAEDGHPIAAMARTWILDDRRPELVDEVCWTVMSDVDSVLTAWCLEHALVPADPVQRVTFFVLTGQFEQYRAQDPDGSLLVLSYQAAPSHIRDRLRPAMAAAGDLDVVRVLTGRSEPMPASEIRYLTEHLAGRGDWAQLWRVAVGLPLVHAVRATALMVHSGWRPEGEGGALFERLGAANVASLSAAGKELVAPKARQLDCEGRVTDALFSPDGRRLATIAVRRDQNVETVSVFELPRAHVVERFTQEARTEQSQLLAIDNHAVIWWQPMGERRGKVVRGSAGKTSHLWTHASQLRSVARYEDGFAGVTDEQDASGPHLRTWRFTQPQQHARVALPTDHGGDWFMLGGIDGGRVVLRGFRCMMIIEPFGQLRLHKEVPGGVDGVCSLGPDEFATTGPDGLRRWEFVGEKLKLAAGPVKLADGVRDPIALTTRGEIAVLNGYRVCYLDASSLSVIKERGRAFTDRVGDRLWGSPQGTWHALGLGEDLEILPGVPSPAAKLVTRPLGETTPADLRTVAYAMLLAGPESPTWPFLELFRACLEYRFSTEVSLGAAGSVPAGEHDIALGGHG